MKPSREPVDRIAAWIVGGRFGPGETLPTEPALGEELGVSRTVVREALKMLSAKGLVVTGPRVGTRVRPKADWNLFDIDVLDWRLAQGVDATFVRDLLELRLAIEPTAARLAARSGDAGDHAAIAAAYARMVDAVSGRGNYFAADLAFHQAVLQATHNQFIAGMTPAFSALLRVSFRLSIKSSEAARGSLPMHKRLLDAIVARHERGAERSTTKLIEAARVDIESGVAGDASFLLGAPA